MMNGRKQKTERVPDVHRSVQPIFDTVISHKLLQNARKAGWLLSALKDKKEVNFRRRMCLNANRLQGGEMTLCH